MLEGSRGTGLDVISNTPAIGRYSSLVHVVAHASPLGALQTGLERACGHRDCVVCHSSTRQAVMGDKSFTFDYVGSTAIPGDPSPIICPPCPCAAPSPPLCHVRLQHLPPACSHLSIKHSACLPHRCMIRRAHRRPSTASACAP